MSEYMSILVRKDGEEFGVMFYGESGHKVSSVFPSDMFEHCRLHDSFDQALEYMESVWKLFYGMKSFYAEMVNQKAYQDVCESMRIC